MYIGPWQEFRLGRVLANLSTHENQNETYVVRQSSARVDETASHVGSIRSEPVGLERHSLDLVDYRLREKIEDLSRRLPDRPSLTVKRPPVPRAPRGMFLVLFMHLA